jgi:hypothetical protein
VTLGLAGSLQIKGSEGLMLMMMMMMSVPALIHYTAVERKKGETLEVGMEWMMVSSGEFMAE